MADRLRMFVSAGPDMEAEREVIGQAVAKLPVPIGWVIKRTPHRGEPLALEAVESCDFYVLLLGSDISAPVGVELMAARKAGKVLLAFLKDVTHTPAAHAFAKVAGLDWMPFASAQELGTLLQKVLAQHILDRALNYKLSPIEYETLSAFLEELNREEKGEQAPEQKEREPGGAGEGGVIIAPGRDLPPGGVPIEG
ncbi:MAG: hypothetical protein ACE5MB_01100 [Anaerolineae bacterium]